MPSYNWKQFIKQLIYYHTEKVVQIRSWKLGLLNYFVIFCIIFYIGFWVIYWNKGYQSTGTLIGDTSVKVKGAAYWVNGTEQNPDDIVVWDAQDVVYPPKEPEALFVTTNFLETPMQYRSICSSGTSCTDNSTCPPLYSQIANGTGISTGQCENNFCTMYAWCQPEPYVQNVTNYLVGVNNFTVFVRVTIKYPKYDVMLNNANGTQTTPGYNQFTISQMLGDVQYEDVQQEGCAIGVIITWNCDLDHSTSECQPSFDYIRLDDPSPTSFSHGYNFRYAIYYYLPNGDGTFTQYRDLFKVYGIRYIFFMVGEASEFSIVPLVISIGSGLALLSIAALISDCITLWILPDRNFYRKAKYEMLEDPSDYKLISQDSDEEEAHHDSMRSLPRSDREASRQLLIDSVKFS